MIIIVGLIIAFVLVLIFSNRSTRNCRWRRIGFEADHGRYSFRCAACGSEAVIAMCRSLPMVKRAPVLVVDVGRGAGPSASARRLLS